MKPTAAIARWLRPRGARWPRRAGRADAYPTRPDHDDRAVRRRRRHRHHRPHRVGGAGQGAEQSDHRGAAARRQRRDRLGRRRARGAGRLHAALHRAVDLFAQSQPDEGAALRPAEGPRARSRRSAARPWMLAVPADSPFKTVADVVAYGKANPGKLAFPFWQIERAGDRRDVRPARRHPDAQGALQGPGRGDDRLPRRPPADHVHRHRRRAAAGRGRQDAGARPRRRRKRSAAFPGRADDARGRASTS